MFFFLISTDEDKNKNDSSMYSHIIVLEAINVRKYRRGNQKWTTYGTQDEDKQIKNTTQYVLDTTIRKQTQIT